MTYRERIRPPQPEDPIYLIEKGPAFHSSAALILVQFAVAFGFIAIVAALLK